MITVAYPDQKVLVPVPPLGEPGAIRGLNSPPPYIEIIALRWIAADRLVFATNDQRIFAVNVEGNDLRLLADPVSLAVRPDLGDTANQALSPLVARHPRLVAFLPTDSQHVVIAAEGGMGTTFIKVDVLTGQQEEIGKAKPGAFIVDQEGRPRIFSSSPPMFGLQKLSYSAEGPADPKAEDFDHYLGGNFAPFEMSPETHFGRRSIPLGFGANPDVLYFASNSGRDTYGIYALNLKTKKRLDFAVEDPHFDLAGPEDFCSTAPLIFDAYSRALAGVHWTGAESGTRWFDPELQKVQDRLDADFPHRAVRIEGWDQARSRYLVRVADEADPGRCYLYEAATDQLTFLVRCAPWLQAEELNLTEPFSFTSAAGVQLTGYFTMPRHPRVSPPALVVLCHGGLGGRDEPVFNSDVQMVAAMGFAVLQVNYRGSSGFGAEFFDDGRKNFGDDPANDVAAAVDWIISQKRIDTKRIAAIGHGFGGYVALRALQLYPEKFRAGVVIDPVTDLDRAVHDNLRNLRARATESDEMKLNAVHELTTGLSGAMSTSPGQMGMVFDQMRGSDRALRTEREMQLPYTTVLASYFGDDTARLQAMSPALHPAAFRQPVFIIQNLEGSVAEEAQAAELRDAMEKYSAPRAYLGINRAFDDGVPGARVAVYSRIGEFLNLTLYDFQVKLGTVKILR
ncbi:MAG TPA: alpha/beta fold hydrolase [Opitutaceae bacterium]|nr:alpha/beta fold hydrolase [Opitutaceae bacterium]